MDPIYTHHTLTIASFIGSVAFALSGFFVGARKKLDVMGIAMLAFLTANGGGIIRDLLIGKPPVILTSMEPFWITAVVVATALIFRLHWLADLEKRWFFVVCDGVGLVAFAITGSLIGIEQNVHFFGVLTLALLTATGGGIIRDLLVNEVPELLHGGFYGSIALLLGGAIYGLHIMGWISPLSLLLLFGTALATRLIAYRQAWRLPRVK
jgi:uncharacterized membrane protein YeiH